MSVDTPGNIVQSFPKSLYAAKSKNIYSLLKQLVADEDVESCYAFGEFLHFTLKSEEDKEITVEKIAERHPLEDLEINPVTPTIEDIFIRLMRENSTNIETDGK
jgi:hypothetical protein